MLGKEGRYMSIDRGSKAVSDPSRMVNETLARDISDELGASLIPAYPKTVVPRTPAFPAPGDDAAGRK